ncbi:hypothetical protein GCM10007049_23000 [Echinicola pacifica]|uniref:Gylcosyl hydrolase 115 C-terminal domain-containing protein n=1 Tax=Echinicola pacifica TaxID=346377 RepID=A0A918URL7_9BACT|nr:glycosyl hydrolase 115 family protein [Echinicola pacifica]GGZ29206.1 hypothetical protein GCM10007049_23000 [Echinicola pacifica]
MKQLVKFALIGLFLSLSFIGKCFSQELQLAFSQPASGDYFPLVAGEAIPILVEQKAPKAVKVAAGNLQMDIEHVTSHKPALYHSPEEVNTKRLVIIGVDGESSLLSKMEDQGLLDLEAIRGQWETYQYTVVPSPLPGVEEALVIAGSDMRGAIYGIYEVSRQMGVSPWSWWADVPVTTHEEVYFPKDKLYSMPPSVKYRGIFINDEDWGLQPWAAKTYEPETEDIGPKTYAKVFELLLRLKANLLWPAMHPSTKAFFHYPGNAQAAKDYGVVLGTSHAEPMLRNNVDEWSHEDNGEFNYTSNQQNVYRYWEERVQESARMDAIYTLGMRGVHDSGMEGVSSTKEAAAITESLIKDQRGLLANYIDRPLSEIPQAFTVYKEVLKIYDEGLELPDDITIVWPDDNYGYIRRLSDEVEQKRSGGAGVYYHASYWGRPHDYLWLSSAHPALIREEMMKAYEMKARDIWVLNVGDIKPLEFNIQLFLDMAYQAVPFEQSDYLGEYEEAWYQEIFGDLGKDISSVMREYYHLAFERRPEFMAWSQTEPTTAIQESAYSPFVNGDEVEQRILAYERLENQLKNMLKILPEQDKSAFYELAYYPVRGASLMNKKFLYWKKALEYAREGRLSAADYAGKSQGAFEEIIAETRYYNKELAGGKWDYMMDYAPRRLPVYQSPVDSLPKSLASHMIMGISPEQTGNKDMGLPVFYSSSSRTHFFDVYLQAEGHISWEVSSSAPYISLSKSSGRLDPENKEERVWVAVNWKEVPEGYDSVEKLIVAAGDQRVELKVPIKKVPALPAGVDYIAENGRVLMYAENHSSEDSARDTWEKVAGLGHSGNVMMTSLEERGSGNENTSLTYAFFLEEEVPAARVRVAALPSHPLTRHHGLKIGISINGGAVQVLDFETEGRSEEWKENVLSNKASKQLKDLDLKAGKNIIQIHKIDPAVMVDYIQVDLQSPEWEDEGYGLPKETRVQR